VASPSLVPFPQHDPPTHKCLLHSLIFGCVRKIYSRATYALAPFSCAPTSFDNTSTFITLHLESNGYFSLFLKDYEPDQDLEFSHDSFKLAFQCMPHLLASGLFGMVFEHLQDCFHPKKSMIGFL
jgi:hypothetical protein